MPTVQGTDLFYHNDFTVPGGGPYSAISGTPARDTTVLRPGDPASLLIETTAATERVQYTLSPTPNLGWCAFGFRQNTGEEPSGNTTLLQFWTNGFGVPTKLYWVPGSNDFSLTVNDNNYQTKTVSLDAWHWMEIIYEANSTTHTAYARLDGVDFTPATLAGQSSTQVQYLELGSFANTNKVRYSHVMWGSAASTTDWLGEPTGQILLPDADVVTTGWATAPLFSKINDSSDATVITATAS
jgi:hypothetical protein